MTASLIIKNVSESDLFENYTCKLDSDSQPSSFVTITLTKKTRKYDGWIDLLRLHLDGCSLELGYN